MPDWLPKGYKAPDLNPTAGGVQPFSSVPGAVPPPSVPHTVALPELEFGLDLTQPELVLDLKCLTKILKETALIKKYFQIASAKGFTNYNLVGATKSNQFVGLKIMLQGNNNASRRQSPP